LEIDIPELSLVLLAGDRSSNKHEFIKRHFSLDEVLYLNTKGTKKDGEKQL
jgi:predicted kinase